METYGIHVLFFLWQNYRLPNLFHDDYANTYNFLNYYNPLKREKNVSDKHSLRYLKNYLTFPKLTFIMRMILNLGGFR